MPETTETPKPIRFIVSILCTRGAGYAQFMESGIVTRPNGKKFFQPTRERRKAMTFAKFTAEELVATLRTSYRLTARVEPVSADHKELAPYER
jgi:hypothetical protein